MATNQAMQDAARVYEKRYSGVIEKVQKNTTFKTNDGKSFPIYYSRGIKSYCIDKTRLNEESTAIIARTSGSNTHFLRPGLILDTLTKNIQVAGMPGKIISSYLFTSLCTKYLGDTGSVPIKFVEDAARTAGTIYKAVSEYVKDNEIDYTGEYDTIRDNLRERVDSIMSTETDIVPKPRAAENRMKLFKEKHPDAKIEVKNDDNYLITLPGKRPVVRKLSAQGMPLKYSQYRTSTEHKTTCKEFKQLDVGDIVDTDRLYDVFEKMLVKDSAVGDEGERIALLRIVAQSDAATLPIGSQSARDLNLLYDTTMVSMYAAMAANI